MPNLFETAAVTESKKPAAGKKSKKATVHIEGLETLASIVALKKALEALEETYRANAKDQAAEQFIGEGTALKRRPENFKGVEGDATASCELRQRSSASALSEIEQDLCRKYNVATEVREDMVETFIINPEYKDDVALLEKVSKALERVPGLPPKFLLRQVPNRKVVVAEESLDQVFNLPAKVVRQLLPVVGTLAVKPQLGHVDLAAILERITPILCVEEDEEGEGE